MYILKCDLCENISSVAKAYKEGWAEVNLLGQFDANKKIICFSCLESTKLFPREKEVIDNSEILKVLKEEGIL